MKLYAISDLHVDRAVNWRAVQEMPAHPHDWLILAGDISQNETLFQATIELLSQRFARLFWTPGNHDLWTNPRAPKPLRGVFKYNQLVSICRTYGVLTPEDPYIAWPSNPPCWIAPIFTLYDYSFRPDHIPLSGALQWAAETNTIATDEFYLHPDPFSSRADWCLARTRYTKNRLLEASLHHSLLLAGHYPLRQDLVHLPRIPRFSLWCGTKLTEDWHTLFPVKGVVYGHLHIRGQYERDNVPFFEVSLGYPEQWQLEKGINSYLRQILPTP